MCTTCAARCDKCVACLSGRVTDSSAPSLPPIALEKVLNAIDSLGFTAYDHVRLAVRVAVCVRAICVRLRVRAAVRSRMNHCGRNTQLDVCSGITSEGGVVRRLKRLNDMLTEYGAVSAIDAPQEVLEKTKGKRARMLFKTAL